MPENTKEYTLRDDEIGTVRISEELLSIIAALAATEVDGVSSMAGNITHEIIRRMGMRNLSQGVRAETDGKTVSFDLALNIDYGRGIKEVSKEVQERVKNAVETMTGIEVTAVRVRVVNVDLQNRS